MGKLHEILAVESDLEGSARRVMEEAAVTFVKRADHFTASYRKLRIFDELLKDQETEEHKAMVTTVPDKLGYMLRSVGKHYDASFQKNVANTVAKADLVVDGEVLATDVPATFLLGLETKLKKLREVYEKIPTLSPGVDWEPDSAKGPNIYKAAHKDKKFKTAQTINHKILVEPTEHHPAQIERWTEQVPVGEYALTAWSGMLSPSQKSVLLGRIDALIRGAKRARSKANNTDVPKVKISESLFNFIHAGGAAPE